MGIKLRFGFSKVEKYFLIRITDFKWLKVIYGELKWVYMI